MSTFVVAVSAIAALVSPASAQKFPDKAVTVILPFPAGTGPDSVMRQVGDKLSKKWGQPFIVENRPGANGWTAVEAVKKADPDGYTLLQIDNLLFALQPHVFKKLPFDPAKDLVPVAPLYQTNFFVVVPAESPWKTIPDLVEAARAKGGGMTFGSSGVASHMHLGGEMLESATDVKMTHVPIKDTPQVFVSVANGELDWAFGSASSSGPMYRAHKVKYLALAAPKRHPTFPDVPTVAEAGGPADFELKSWVALFARTGTPQEIVDQINADVTEALAEADVKDRLISVGFTPWADKPAGLAKALEEDSKLFGDVAKRENISLD
ncbi:tripartite tricarboxylate transporter substrate binding protein [Aureimonas sp. Leaf324]|uniref:Bug family tripartite tricarboxylate transporter substrate binding protein n=1 Tax=Aureimonas sp. Leaf324 TaxID=1736336 RepID=UPI000700E88D|nr:tripartite tricarboxylate transporter substrate binding protein [Aureimonas sp. Leaf324]KQQ86253.1 TctC [Aureimonas sp. Leaf324]